MEIFGYRKLVAYQKAKEVVKRTYKLLKKFPAEDRYAMCDQLRRASVSITSNINCVFLCRDSGKSKRAWISSRCSVRSLHYSYLQGAHGHTTVPLTGCPAYSLLLTVDYLLKCFLTFAPPCFGLSRDRISIRVR